MIAGTNWYYILKDVMRKVRAIGQAFASPFSLIRNFYTSYIRRDPINYFYGGF